MHLGSLFGRLKVKNTFVEVGYETDDTVYAGGWKQQSEPMMVTEKLLGSSFSRILDAQHSDLKLGSSSSAKSASFCASIPETVCETEWEGGEDSSGWEWSDMEAMVRQVTEEPWHTLEQEHVNTTPATQTPSISLVEALPIDVVPEVIETEATLEDQSEPQSKCKSRRRRKRDSLIDKAAKERQKQSASSPEGCPRCGGICEQTFKFCQFCGMTLA